MAPFEIANGPKARTHLIVVRVKSDQVIRVQRSPFKLEGFAVARPTGYGLSRRSPAALVPVSRMLVHIDMNHLMMFKYKQIRSGLRD